MRVSLIFFVIFMIGLLPAIFAFDEDEYLTLATPEEKIEYLIEDYNEEYARELLITYPDHELLELHLITIQDFSNPEDIDIFLTSLETPEGINMLNTNKFLFAKYLEEYKISFEKEPVGNFLEYNQEEDIFVTEGDASTSFSVDVLSNMELTGFHSFDIAEDGSLIFYGFSEDMEGEVKVESGDFTVLEDGTVSLNHGTLFVEKLGGEIELPEDCSSCFVDLYDDHLTVSGEYLLLPSDNILMTGEIEYYSQTHALLAGGSSILTNTNIKYSVSEDTDIFQDKLDHGANAQSYIQFNPIGELTINAKEENKIRFSVPEDQRQFYVVNVFTEEEGDIVFKQGNFIGFFENGEANIVGTPPLKINTEKGEIFSHSFCQKGAVDCNTRISQGIGLQKDTAHTIIRTIDFEGTPILSQKGYYEYGDEAEEGTVDYLNILAIQEITGALDKGAMPGDYDEVTKESVLEWQELLQKKYAEYGFPVTLTEAPNGKWDKATAVATENQAFLDDPDVSYHKKENFEVLYDSLRTRSIAEPGNCAAVVMHIGGIIKTLEERGMEPSKENIQKLLNEQQQGLENDYLYYAKFSGISDSAWDMSASVREHGGETFYWREKEGGLTEKELKQDPYYPFDDIQPGDVIGIWYEGLYSPIGKEGRSNSHVAAIVGKERQTYQYDSSRDFKKYLQETLDIKSENILKSVPVYVPDKDSIYKRAYDIGGEYYFIENGEQTRIQLEQGTPIIVERHILAHEIIELSEGYLDKELDKEVMSFYEHMRPAQDPTTTVYELMTPLVVQSGIAMLDRKADTLIARGKKALISEEIID